MDLTCYKCGAAGHVKRDCPAARAVPPAPLEGGTDPRPAHDDMALYRRPASERAQYEDVAPWAQWVREKMGWDSGPEQREARLRALAAEQVAEARAARAVMG